MESPGSFRTFELEILRELFILINKYANILINKYSNKIKGHDIRKMTPITSNCHIKEIIEFRSVVYLDNLQFYWD